MTNDFRLRTAVAIVICSSISAFFGAYIAVRLPMDNFQTKASDPIDLDTQLIPFLDTIELADQPVSVPDSSTEPGRLPASIRANALADRRPNVGANIRPLIEEELPEATAEEREIWYDELKELTPDAARDILRLRKVLGESWEAHVLRSATIAPPR